MHGVGCGVDALRSALGWSDRTLRRQLARLVELEYVVVYRTGRGNGRAYQLLYDGQGRDGRPTLLGLIDPAELRQSDTDSAHPLPRPPSKPVEAAHS